MAKILVFDDEPSILLMIKKMLEREGHEVDIALNGREGMDRLAKNIPDLVITDLIMPEKEGLETIIELKSNYPGIKIIAISGGGRIGPEGYLPGAKHLGANVILQKPLDQSELIGAVSSLLK